MHTACLCSRLYGHVSSQRSPRGAGRGAVPRHIREECSGRKLFVLQEVTVFLRSAGMNWELALFRRRSRRQGRPLGPGTETLAEASAPPPPAALALQP